MALELVKLYSATSTFLKDATITSGDFSTSIDQGAGSKGIKGKTQDEAGNLSAFSSLKNYYATINDN